MKLHNESNDPNIQIIKNITEDSIKTENQNLENRIIELINLIQTKDSKITELYNQEKLNKNIIESQKKHLKHQENIILQQIGEIHSIKREIILYSFYKPHPKDFYTINFGHIKYRGWTYRKVISNRDGKNLCRWVLTKTTIDTQAIKEFKQYLKQIKYKLY